MIKNVKKIVLALTVTCTPISFLAFSAGHAQAPDQTETLPFLWTVEAFAQGTRSALEQQSVHMRVNAGPMQIGAADIFYEMQGVRSPMRFANGADFHFLARSPGEGVDPSTVFKLYRAEPRRKKYRRVKISHSSFTEGLTLRMDREQVPVKFDISSNGLVRIYPMEPLPAGEYAFILIDRAFAFGID